MYFMLAAGSSHCTSHYDNPFFNLPQDIEWIADHHTLKGDTDCTLWVRFRLAPEKLDDILATTSIKMPLSSSELPQRIGGIERLQAETGWDLSGVVSFLAGEGARTGGEQTVFVDTSDPEYYMVYLTTRTSWLI